MPQGVVPVKIEQAFVQSTTIYQLIVALSLKSRIETHLTFDMSVSEF